MANNIINRYVWFIDTITRFGALTFKQISELWIQTTLSKGKPLALRTFHTYRNEIEQTFGVNIKCNRVTYEYYIDKSDSNERLHRWLLDSMAVSNMVRGALDIADRIVTENVPSAREHLPLVVDAMRENRRLRFDYKSHKRITGKRGVVIEPYFLKIFKQLWYVIGLSVKDEKIKTYALDRMRNVTLQSETFVLPPDITPATFFADCFGITTSPDAARDILLRVEPTQAKYLRALPLHPSQQEVVHDDYSLFSYRMRITYDLREVLLSYGSNVEVLAPPELRRMIRNELKRSLELYK